MADRRPPIHFEQQGVGDPLLLIPCLASDNGCWAFQLPAYAERFTCIAVDLPGSGESPVSEGRPSTEHHADELCALLDALGVESAHVAGVSLGAGVGMQLAARHPARVRSLSLHSAWPATDPFMRACMESWRTQARADHLSHCGFNEDPDAFTAVTLDFLEGATR